MERVKLIAIDHVNRLLQIEIEKAPPDLALELAQIKFEINQRFDEKRRMGADTKENGIPAR